MKVLHLATSPLEGGYSSDALGRGWKRGEVREVTAEQAAYLTSTFPDAFVEQHDPVPARRGRKPAAPTLPPEPEAPPAKPTEG